MGHKHTKNKIDTNQNNDFFEEKRKAILDQINKIEIPEQVKYVQETETDKYFTFSFKKNRRKNIARSYDLQDSIKIAVSDPNCSSKNSSRNSSICISRNSSFHNSKYPSRCNSRNSSFHNLKYPSQHNSTNTSANNILK